MGDKDKAYIPSLMDPGWEINPYLNLDRGLAYLYCTNFSQSSLFHGAIVSVSKILEEDSGLLKATMIKMERQLETYLSLFCNKVSVEVTEHSSSKGKGNATIIISGIVEAMGVSIPLNYSVQLKNSKLVDIYRTVNS